MYICNGDTDIKVLTLMRVFWTFNPQTKTQNIAQNPKIEFGEFKEGAKS